MSAGRRRLAEWWERRSIRQRLALWYAAGGTLLVSGFAATLYMYVALWIARPLDHQLREDLKIVEARLTVAADGTLRWDGQVFGEPAPWMTEHPWFEVWDEESRLVRRIWPFSENRTVVLPGPPNRALGTGTISVFYVAPDLRLRALSVLYRVPGREQPWMLRLMRVHQPHADALGALRVIIVVALPVVVALLVAGGYSFTKRWLLPLESMTQEANRITAADLSRRLPVANPHDELGQLAKVFNVTLDRLQESFETLDRFVADASHELRTPLTTLRSVGEVGLRRGRTEDEYREIIGSMLEEAQRLQLLIQRLLELAGAEGGAQAVQRSRLNVGDFVATCANELGILAEYKRQRVLVETQEVTADTDPVLLRQALQNLLDNAIKYSPDAATIRVEVRATERTVEIRVADEGPGIGEESRARLMQRFYRPDRGRGRSSGGFGLGLSITKAYMRVLGGSLEHEPGAAQGSTFRLTLPGG